MPAGRIVRPLVGGNRVIIAGSRSINNFKEVERLMENFCSRYPPPTEIVSGHALGVDMLGERWARHNLIALKVFPADWSKHGLAAGPIRNAEMGDYADALAVAWDGKSTGTKHMIDYMKGKGKPVVIRLVKPKSTPRNQPISHPAIKSQEE